MENETITVKEIRDFILDAYGKSNNDKDMLTMLLENLDDNFHDAEFPSEEDIKKFANTICRNIRDNEEAITIIKSAKAGANYVISYIKSKSK